MSSAYLKQDRGGAPAYSAYFASMDQSMQQKIAHTTAHFPSTGVVADMGSGSGLGTYQLARLYPSLKLVGVDINPVSVRFARETYRLPNLEYREGDIAGKTFPDNSLDGILDSSVLHHVTSFNAFSIDLLAAALQHQVEQLRPGGVIIIRDFVVGTGPEMVWLEVPEADGQPEGEPEQLSTAALFERFARDWRSSVNPDWPVPYKRVDSERPGWARFKVARRAAAEFLLRKDYRRDWATELLEEYTYFSLRQFEELFGRLGLRVVTSQELWNPWIVENRFEGKAQLTSLSGSRLPFPPTNCVVVGEKVERGRGVRLRDAVPRRMSSPQFLSLTSFEHRGTGKRFELARRPHPTVDLVPWFERDGALWVVARQGFPRPIVNATVSPGPLGGPRLAGYLTEPVTAIVPGGITEAALRQLTAERAGIAEGAVKGLLGPMRSFPSPGGINERVEAWLVEIGSEFTRRSSGNVTPFVSAGWLRELELQQLLRAAQVGGLFDARLECNAYHLLLSRGVAADAWIGAAVSLSGPVRKVRLQPLEEALSSGEERPWVPLEGAVESSFLEVRESTFVEEDASGQTLAVGRFEYVLPRQSSAQTVACLPVVRTERGYAVGLERRALPAVQEHTGRAELATCPAWRLPSEVVGAAAARLFVAERLKADFGFSATRIWELGGRYLPTPGLTPEVVYPWAVEVEPSGRDRLAWVALDALLAGAQRIEDGHLKVAVFRLAHALGLLAPPL